MVDVGIINYGMGNLRSIETALDQIGFTHSQVTDARQLNRVRRLILPGVGGFPRAIERLDRQGLAPSLIDWALQGKVLVGICLGMQLLFESSDEISRTSGLGLLSGSVTKLERESNQTSGQRLPNMGWRKIKLCSLSNEQDLAREIRQPFNSGFWMYFAHSFAVFEPAEEIQIATTDFCSKQFAAIVQKGSVVGFQGHPELSGFGGVRILKSALKI